jgi:hypothetical protein
MPFVNDDPTLACGVAVLIGCRSAAQVSELPGNRRPGGVGEDRRTPPEHPSVSACPPCADRSRWQPGQVIVDGYPPESGG